MVFLFCSLLCEFALAIVGSAAGEHVGFVGRLSDEASVPSGECGGGWQCYFEQPSVCTLKDLHDARIRMLARVLVRMIVSCL